MKLKELSGLLPIGSAILIFWGILKLQIYYSYFNLQIANYIELSEIIFSFLNDYLFYSILFVIGLFISVYSTDKNELGKEKSYNNKFLEQENILKRLFLFFKKNISIWVLLNILLLILHFISIRLIGHSYLLFFILASNLALFIIFFADDFRRNYYLTYNIDISGFSFLLTKLFLVFSIFVVVLAIVQAKEVKEMKKYSNYSFKYNEKVISSDSLNYYIGQTKNYIFYYKEKQKETVIYPKKYVSIISIK